MLTGVQIRSARAALRMTASELGLAAGVSLPTVQRLEQHDGIPPSHSGTLQKIKAAFETAGIEFTGAPDDAPGIRVHARPGPR